MTRLIAGMAFVLLVLVSSSASAQLLAAKDGPIVYGHHHLNTANMEAQKRFFVDTLGGSLLKVGTNNLEIVRFPNVLIFFRQQASTGESRGTSVNHIGFSVPDLRVMVGKVKANGFQMITKTEVPPDREVKDDIALAPPSGGSAIAFALAPDGVKVEIVEVKAQTMPIALHHVHFFGQQNQDMRAWYVKTFGAKSRDGAAFLSADLPGVALNFSPSPSPVVGTQGRAIDHIGFEVKNLQEFVKTLQSQGITIDRPYARNEALGVGLAFIKDPWGTYIELTEGLDKIK